MVILIPPEGEQWGDDWLDHVTDDQIRAAYTAAGMDEGYADVVIDVLRDRYDGSDLE